MTNIQTILDICPLVWKHFVSYRSHIVPYGSFQLLKTVVFDLVEARRITLITRCLADGLAEELQLLGS
jgi:hypothetical protein